MNAQKTNDEVEEWKHAKQLLTLQVQNSRLSSLIQEMNLYIYIIYWGVPELVGLLVIVGDPVFGLSHVYWRNTSVSS